MAPKYCSSSKISAFCKILLSLTLCDCILAVKPLHYHTFALKKERLPLLIFLLFLSLNMFAQKEAAIWYFGDGAGLDFNNGSPVALTDGQLSTIEGCSTISDANGSLLFYTDGITIWNRNHDIMVNGSPFTNFFKK